MLQEKIVENSFSDNPNKGASVFSKMNYLKKIVQNRIKENFLM